MTIWSMLAKANANAPESTTSRYGLFTCVSKISQAIAVVIVGLALNSISYRDGGIGSVQLRAFMSLAPIVGSITLIFLVSRVWKHPQ
ncbi:hypothetical protein [Erythrobacter aureus]|uniref:hypothetical protein n=1 Tax=Erythrobacter aureus TaxID=2182384 RepID=UPI001F30FE90|nr:hypothetical protein [Erythrobacter aureus]